MAAWFALHLVLGDATWWLGLLNAFSVYLFSPLAVWLLLGWPAVGGRSSALALPTILFLLLYGRLYLPRLSSPEVAEEPFTVMTFNVMGHELSIDTARAVVSEGIPDIVALQEYTPGMRRRVLDELGDRYPYHAERPYPGIHGLGILSRHPLTEIDATHLGDSLWRIQIVRVEIDGHPVLIYNVHLTSSDVFGYLDSSIATLARELERDLSMREAQAQCLLDDIASRSEPVIVVGDVNSADRSDVQRLRPVDEP
ncbi:MAG: endonuclease/exonuclease/phosphatase family protein [Anaerolineae bacterium]|jgi:endonuclease/exonuclease/phosphatase (EEP) superfamily protein YafD